MSARMDSIARLWVAHSLVLGANKAICDANAILGRTSTDVVPHKQWQAWTAKLDRLNLATHEFVCLLENKLEQIEEPTPKARETE